MRSYWQQWGGALSEVCRADGFDEVLAGAARALCEAAETGGGLETLGIDIVEVDLPDRSGGVVDSWERKVVRVDRHHRGTGRTYVVAHEVGHLLLGYVHRSRRYPLGQAYEERLCDAFADHVMSHLGDGRLDVGGPSDERRVAMR